VVAHEHILSNKVYVVAHEHILSNKVYVVAHLYHLAQQKLCYEIVKNRLRNTQNDYILTSKLQLFFSG